MKKILLVDDSRCVRMVMHKIMDDLGLEVLEAEDGQKALEAVQNHADIDAVLLDWHMPVKDGLSFLKELRKEQTISQPVVIMCTTENEMSRIVEAMQAGANEFIMKPFSEDVVREKFEMTGIL